MKEMLLVTLFLLFTLISTQKAEDSDESLLVGEALGSYEINREQALSDQVTSWLPGNSLQSAILTHVNRLAEDREYSDTIKKNEDFSNDFYNLNQADFKITGSNENTKLPKYRLLNNFLFKMYEKKTDSSNAEKMKNFKTKDSEPEKPRSTEEKVLPSPWSIYLRNPLGVRYSSTTDYWQKKNKIPKNIALIKGIISEVNETVNTETYEKTPTSIGRNKENNNKGRLNISSRALSETPVGGTGNNSSLNTEHGVTVEAEVQEDETESHSGTEENVMAIVVEDKETEQELNYTKNSNGELAYRPLTREMLQRESSNEPVFQSWLWYKSAEFQPVNFFQTGQSESGLKKDTTNTRINNDGKKSEPLPFFQRSFTRDTSGPDLFPSSIFEEEISVPFFSHDV